jgi:hypothetical protein
MSTEIQNGSAPESGSVPVKTINSSSHAYTPLDEEKLTELDPDERALAVIQAVPVLMKLISAMTKPAKNRAVALTINNTKKNRADVIRALRELRLKGKELQTYLNILYYWSREVSAVVNGPVEELAEKLGVAVATGNHMEVLAEDKEQFVAEFKKRCKNSIKPLAKQFMNNEELLLNKAQDALMLMAQEEDSETIPEQFFETYDLIGVKKMAKESARKRGVAEQEEQAKQLAVAANLAQQASKAPAKPIPAPILNEEKKTATTV